MPARCASKFCAKRCAALLHIFCLSLIYCVIPGNIEPWPECQPEDLMSIVLRAVLLVECSHGISQKTPIRSHIFVLQFGVPRYAPPWCMFVFLSLDFCTSVVMHLPPLLAAMFGCDVSVKSKLRVRQPNCRWHYTINHHFLLFKFVSHHLNRSLAGLYAWVCCASVSV